MILECFCIGGASEWNWDAIGAVGQWAGALSAASAVWWGIKQTNLAIKSKAKLGVDILQHHEGNILRTFAINKGHSIIRFSSVYIKHKKTNIYVIGNTFYRKHEIEPTKPNDRKTHGFSLKEFLVECTNNNWKDIQVFILEFHDSAGNIFSLKFRFDLNNNLIKE